MSPAQTKKVLTTQEYGGFLGAALAVAFGAGVAQGTVTAEEFGDGVHHKTVLTLTDVVVTMTDATTAGSHGSAPLYEFPFGNIVILGASTNLTTAAGAGGISDTAALVGAIGTTATATDNATLTTVEANIVPSFAGTLTGGAGVIKGKSTTPAAIDGTTTTTSSTELIARLNLAVPDAGSSASDTVTVNGTVTICWMNAGDN